MAHPARRRKEWDSIPGIELDFTSATTKSGASLAFTESRTIIRTMIEYCLAPTSAPTANDAASVTVALMVMATDTFALGVTAFPDPGAEPEYPWLYWRDHPFHYAGVDPESASAAASVRVLLDLKAMRKVKPRESLVWVASYGDFSGNPPITVTFGITRVLLALP